MSVGHRIYWLSKVMQMSAFTIFKMLLTFDSERNMVLIIEIILAKKHCTATVLQFHAVKNSTSNYVIGCKIHINHHSIICKFIQHFTSAHLNVLAW